MALSLVSVNVEWDKHIDTVLPFLRTCGADVLCVQELPKSQIPLYEEAFKGKCLGYAPVTIVERPDESLTIVEAIFSRTPAAVRTKYYAGSPETVRVDTGDSDTDVHVLVSADLEKEGTTYRIVTTHFTWTPNGEPNDDQRRDLLSLFGELDELGEFVLVGDFNAPRGMETFSALSARYKDNIPSEYKTSIDVERHKTRDNPEQRARVATYMVDGLFTTPAYSASDVSLQFGISDHAAIVATITKTT